MSDRDLLRELVEVAKAYRDQQATPDSDNALTTGPCSCECNTRGFCGGCGHAGCGGRR